MGVTKQPCTQMQELDESPSSCWGPRGRVDVVVLALGSALAWIFTGVMLVYPGAGASGAAVGLCAGSLCQTAGCSPTPARAVSPCALAEPATSG